MKITLVKKILTDGSPCKKCADVLNKLDQSGHIKSIDAIVVADERDPNSEGVVLAARYNVDRAPFFIVERPDSSVEIYTIYMKFVKEVLNQQQSAEEEARDILASSNDLDFL